MNSWKLTNRIIDCLSDGYDDEEYREEETEKIYSEICMLPGDSSIRAALIVLCDRIEDLED